MFIEILLKAAVRPRCRASYPNRVHSVKLSAILPAMENHEDYRPDFAPHKPTGHDRYGEDSLSEILSRRLTAFTNGSTTRSSKPFHLEPQGAVVQRAFQPKKVAEVFCD
jgi:hypothetical protein